MAEIISILYLLDLEWILIISLYLKLVVND